jgi:ABC-type multidrug transport system permease subunit
MEAPGVTGSSNSCEESMKRDLNNWSITKDLPFDKREWKLAIYVTEPYLRFLLFYCLLMLVFSFLFTLILLFCVSVFYCLFPFSVLFLLTFIFPLPFHLCFCLCSSAPMTFISSLPQLAGE